MPDRYGFNELGDEVACIQQGCEARGPRWEWPERKRRRHHLSHGAAAYSPAPRRPIHSGNGNGGNTMAGKEKVSGRQACVAAIRAAGKPLTANEIATAVVESGVVPTLKGKTPKATLSAQITSGAKKGQVFKRVGSGKPAKFDLAADAPDTSADLVEALNAKVKEVTSRQPAKRQTAKPQAAKPEQAEAPKQAPASAAAASGGKREVTPDPKPSKAK